MLVHPPNRTGRAAQSSNPYAHAGANQLCPSSQDVDNGRRLRVLCCPGMTSHAGLCVCRAAQHDDSLTRCRASHPSPLPWQSWWTTACGLCSTRPTRSAAALSCPWSWTAPPIPRQVHPCAAPQAQCEQTCPCTGCAWGRLGCAGPQPGACCTQHRSTGLCMGPPEVLCAGQACCWCGVGERGGHDHAGSCSTTGRS